MKLPAFDLKSVISFVTPFVTVHPTTQCWEWQKGRTKNGYGMARINGKNQYIHRIMLKSKIGTLTLDALHRCDNPPCCNPEHLYEGTAKQNYADMVNRGRRRNTEAALKGEESPSSILNRQQVAQIRLRVADGERHWKIAESYGVHRSTVTKIMQGLNWKSVK